MMKTIREFSFLTRECGLFNGFSYLWYKVRHKISNVSWISRWRKRSDERLQKIFAALFIFQHETVMKDGDRYIKTALPHGTSQFVYLRPYSSDPMVFSQMLEMEEYKSVVEIYNQLVKTPPLHIVDCGCNIGLAALYFHKHFPNANLVAVEPFKANARLARLNFENAGLTNYNLLEGGVWNKNTTLFINRAFRDQKEWSVSLSETSEDKGEGIRAYSLLDIVDQAQIVDILKMDVEGAETVLFEDPVYSAAFLKKVKCLAIEIHDEFNCRERIYDALTSNNFFFFNTHELTLAVNRSFL